MGHRVVLGLVTVVAGALGLAACESAAEGCAGNVDVASVVRFNGVLYMGTGLPEGRQIRVGQPIGTGTDACDSDVSVRAIAGVPPQAAVAVVAQAETKARGVYLAPGFFPAMSSHPLHAALFDVRRRWANDARRRCRRPARFTGVIKQPEGSGSRVLVASKIVLIDGYTRYRGPRQASLPYLQGGERLVVRGLACRGKRVVAQRIRARR
jgi:hypothetical protein